MHDEHDKMARPSIPPILPTAGGENDHARFMWTVAGQVSSGMLANPGKQHYSVKDSISLFDEVLHELYSYARVRGDFDEWVRGQAVETDQRRDPQRAVQAGPVMDPAPAVQAEPAPTPIRQPAPAPGTVIAPAPALAYPAAGAVLPGPVPAPGSPLQPATGFAQAPSNASPAGPLTGADRQSIELPDLPLPPAEGATG